MTLSWRVCDLKTGDVIDELPLRVGDLSRTISTKTTSSATLDPADPACPPYWANLLDGMRTMLVPVDDGLPLGGWIIDTANVGDPSVPFGISSLEACADYVFCRDHDFYEGTDDEALALAALFADVIVPSFGFTLDVTPTGRTADHSYSWYEDRTVASAAAELASAEGGPEWTTRVAWEDGTQRRIVKTIQIGPKVGQTSPAVVFDDSHLASRVRRRSWTNRATHVVATGDGAGESRPMSPPVVDQAALDAGVPQWEARVPAATVDKTDLPRVAENALLRRRYGTQTWDATLATAEKGAPRLGFDFDAGDTVSVEFDPRILPTGVVLDPASWHGTARVLGWRAQLTARTISQVTPVFWNPDDQEA